MVHADVHVARFAQPLDRGLHELELHLRARQVGLEDAPLRLEHLRQVRVRIERDAVRIAFNHGVERAPEPFQGLLRQAQDQVHVDGTEAVLAAGVDGRARAFQALDAVHRRLHHGIEVLHADREAIEAQAPEELDAGGPRAPRIDLDRVFAVGREVELGAQRAHEGCRILLGEEGRRAPAPVHLAHAPLADQGAGHEVDLAQQVARVLARLGRVLGGDLVARAVEAQRVAERHVNV